MPRFVEFIPKELEGAVLYISIPYATASHLCACGCGSKIKTPLHPAEWAITYDGETVSLNHSVGNWSYPCQSHYWIRHNKIDWSDQMTPMQIRANRAKDERDRAKYLDSVVAPQVPTGNKRSWLRRLLDRLRQ